MHRPFKINCCSFFYPRNILSPCEAYVSNNCLRAMLLTITFFLNIIVQCSFSTIIPQHNLSIRLQNYYNSTICCPKLFHTSVIHACALCLMRHNTCLLVSHKYVLARTCWADDVGTSKCQLRCDGGVAFHCYCHRPCNQDKYQ